MKNTERLKKHCSELGIKSDRYVELLDELEKLPQLQYFTGTDFQDYDTLARWSFVQKLTSPIVKDGRLTGRNILYAPIGVNLRAESYGMGCFHNLESVGYWNSRPMNQCTECGIYVEDKYTENHG